MINRRFLCLAAALALVAGCATQPVPVSVADTLAQTPSLSTLHGLVVKAGLNDTFKGPGPFTVFAPNNDAFKAVSARTMDEREHKNHQRCTHLIGFHECAYAG